MEIKTMVKTKPKDPLLEHDYDGIQELDNDLPPWWLYLFYATIIWGIMYLLYFHVLAIGDSSYAEYMKEIDPEWVESHAKKAGSLEYKTPFFSAAGDITPLSRMEEYEAALLESQSGKKRGDLDAGIEDLGFEDLIIAAMRIAEPENLTKLQNTFPDIWDKAQSVAKDETKGEMVAATSVADESEFAMEVLTDEASLSAGGAIFEANCATCHGKFGEGGIGPNFTDEYFIHGGSMKNTVKIIKQGVPAKGMISWRGILKDLQIQQVASYILKLQGTNPPNAKAPQGEKVELLPAN
jgi:mono/diheme cytochrome c family protein